MNADDTREDLIAYCGRCFEEAMKTGDRGLAYFWLGAQNEQIKLRSPEQVERMEAERGIA